FLKQAFFAPLVVFFLWLAIKTSEGMGSGSQFATTMSGSGSFLADALGAFLAPVMQKALQAAMIIGLSLGGLFAANSLSIAGAKGAYGLAKGTAKGFGTLAGDRFTRRLARSATPGYEPKPAKGRVGQFFQNTLGRAYRGTLQGVAGKLPRAIQGAVAVHGAEERKSLGRILFDGMGKESGLWKPGKHEVDPKSAAAVLEALNKIAGRTLTPDEAEKEYNVKFAQKKVRLPNDPKTRKAILDSLGISEEEAKKRDYFDWEGKEGEEEKGEEKKPKAEPGAEKGSRAGFR
ncbi:MAG: hypothetical protein AAB967_03285, partial [Patescibacteria group bacterium]